MIIGKSFLIQHFMDAVWLIKPEKLKTMTEVILKKASDINGSLNLLQFEKKESSENSIIQREGKTAILNIEGVLVSKASWLDAMCGFTSTLDMNNQFNKLVEDDKVERIVLYFDSPGGETTGIFEFANDIFQARSKKEIVAFTDVDMCSAAYWLGTAAEQLIATPSSVIGSIGCYMSVLKEKAEQSTYDVHIIQAGENKLFGSQETVISDEEIAYFQERIDNNYEQFTNAVAQYRNVTQAEVKKTKASWYNSIDAPKWMYDEIGNSKMVLN